MLKNLLGLSSLILLFGCSMKHDVDPLKVEPIHVTHEITVDRRLVEFYYYEKCEAELPEDALEEEIEDCAAENVAHFFLALNSSKIE